MENLREYLHYEPSRMENNKMLFLFPSKFYFDDTDTGKYAKVFDRIIDGRYRQKGYSIYYLVFENEDVHYLRKQKGDVIIKSDVRFDDEHYCYTPNEVIAK